MSSIVGDVRGEALRKAVNWLCERNSYTLADIEQAARRFDLSPLDENFLLEVLSQRKSDTQRAQRK